MAEPKDKQTTGQVQENPEATIKRLTEEKQQLIQYLEQTSKENQVLRATVKALSQLL